MGCVLFPDAVGDGGKGRIVRTEEDKKTDIPVPEPGFHKVTTQAAFPLTNQPS